MVQRGRFQAETRGHREETQKYDAFILLRRKKNPWSDQDLELLSVRKIKVHKVTISLKLTPNKNGRE